MSTRRSALPVAVLALAKALAQLQIARSAACVSDQNLAAEIAEAEALLERLRARIVGVGKGAHSAKCERAQAALGNTHRLWAKAIRDHDAPAAAILYWPAHCHKGGLAEAFGPDRQGCGEGSARRAARGRTRRTALWRGHRFGVAPRGVAIGARSIAASQGGH